MRKKIFFLVFALVLVWESMSFPCQTLKNRPPHGTRPRDPSSQKHSHELPLVPVPSAKHMNISPSIKKPQKQDKATIGAIPVDGLTFRGQRFDLKFEGNWAASDDVIPFDIGPIKEYTSFPIGGASLVTNDTRKRATIELEFVCSIEDKVQCQKAEKSMIDAIDLLTQVIVLKKSIKVRTNYTTFCGSTEDQECSQDTLGQAAAANYWVLSDVPGLDPDFRYPQALAKQFSPSGIDWGETDIVAQFNAIKVPDHGSLDRFWFDSDETPIHSRQYDFKYIALHELIHGLGFLSSWTKALPLAENILAPMYRIYGQKGKFTSIDGALQPYIFDKYLYFSQDSRPVMEIYRNMTPSILSKYQSFPDWLEKFKASDAIQHGKELYQKATTPGSIELRIPTQDKKYMIMSVDTSYPEFKAGSSISHLDHKIFTDSEDFLMRPEADRGRTLEQLTPRDKFPVGPGVIQILQTMGYSISNTPLPQIGLGYNFAVTLRPGLLSLILILVIAI